MKKLLASILATTMLIGGTISVYASTGENIVDTNREYFEEDINDTKPKTRAIMVPQTQYFWEFKTQRIGKKTYGNWKLCYDDNGNPASRDGETVTASASTDYSHTFSGSFATNIIKDKVQATLGYSYGKGKGLSVSKTSAPLKKGEYVKAYYKNTYEETRVTQEEHKRRYGWTQSRPGGPYTYIDETSRTGVTRTVISQKAILPSLKIEYWKGNSKIRSILASSPERIEYYDYIDGKYVLTDVEK